MVIKRPLLRDTLSLVRRGERRRREGDNNEDEKTVIGVETGELPCGALLARNRLSVLVAEQSSKPGGYRTSFEHKGSPTAALGMKNSVLEVVTRE